MVRITYESINSDEELQIIKRMLQALPESDVKRVEVYQQIAVVSHRKYERIKSKV